MNLLERRKPIDVILSEGSSAHHGLKRSMGVVGLTAIGIATIIGAGIFVLTGVAAANFAGPAIVVSYVIAGVVCALSAFCYAELASCVPISGSAYTYTYATLGELLAWIIGWDLILEYAFGAATVSIGWSEYFVDFLKPLGIVVPHALAASPAGGGMVNLPAMLIVLLVTALLIAGTSETNGVNKFIVGLKLLVVLFFVVVAAPHVDPANWHPFVPFGWGGVFTGASLIFFAYIGFDVVSTSAEEAVNPQRDLPRAIIASLAICTVLYILVSGILTGVVKYTALAGVSAPVSFALLHLGLNWAAAIISVGAIAGLTTVLIGLLYGQSRIFFTMSRDRLLPPIFSQLHPKLRTPWRSSLLIGVVVAFVAGFTPIEKVQELTNIGTLAAFFLVSIGVLILRRREPNLERGFRVPGAPVVPVLSALGALVLIVKLPGLTFVSFTIWLVLGLAVYFGYSRKASRYSQGT
jgi:APA family basic amino acid/polyamine antiporter